MGKRKENFMKIIKRALAVLLLFALLISCLLLTVSAEETFKAKGITDIEDVLEYFEKDYYFSDDYQDGEWSDYYTANAINSEVVADPELEGNKVLEVTGAAKYNKYHVPVSTDTLVISFDLYYDESMTGAYTVDLITKDALGVEDSTFTSFLKIDAVSGAVKNSVFDPALNNGSGAYILSDYEGFVTESNVWYNVAIFLNAVENKYSFKISDDGGESWHASPDFTISASLFTQVELKPYLEGRNVNDVIFFYLDNVKAYEGTFERYPDEQNAIIEQTIKDLEALYNADGTDNLIKMRIAAVFEKLKSYYQTENAEIVSILTKATNYINLAYADEMIKRAEAIDASAPYHDRESFVAEFYAYSDKLPANDVLSTLDGFSENAELVEAVKAARELFAIEKAACELVKAHSSAFKLHMYGYNENSDSYDYLKSFYDEVSLYTDVDYTFSGAVAGTYDYTMEEAKADFEAFTAKYQRISAVAEAFLNGTDKMLSAVADINAYLPGDAEYEDAFALLSEGYYTVDGVILSVYTGALGDLASAKIIDLDAELDELSLSDFVERNQVFFEYKDMILKNMEIGNSFVTVMIQASTASYYTAKESYFKAAKLIYEQIDENGRPALRVKAYGVSEYVTIYHELANYFVEAEKSAAAYVNAVNEAIRLIEDPTATMADKIAAIEAARALKESGDINGIDGVTQANSDLSKYSTYLNSVIADSESLITIASQLAGANTFAARRTLLVAAAKAAKNCDKSIEGVAEAYALFESYKAAYESEVAAMNASHLSATVNGLATVGAAAADAEVYTAVDIISQYAEHISKAG